MATEQLPQLPFNFAKQQGVIITQASNDVVAITHREKITATTLQELRRLLQRPLQLKPVNDDTFSQLLTKTYQASADSAQQVIAGMEQALDLEQVMQTLPKPEDLLESQDDAPIIKLINTLLSQAIQRRASDIHFEPYTEHVKIRYRIDGVLHDVLKPPITLAPLLTSRLKVMAKLDIAEKRLPQDGRISLNMAGRDVDVRISTIPASHGERVVLRILDKQAARLDLMQLGMNEKNLACMQQLIQKSHGIILVTGPTGSGKTTTLYAALNQLNTETRNILTVEDPIEYDILGIGQTQVNPKVKMTFARGFRAILRQDPDVVMVGEIRDLETAEIAVQASLTGHLVLSTLHTNNAIGAITRLRDMGVQSFLLASSLIGVAAQRLVRLLCSQCKQRKTATAEACKLLGVDAAAAPVLYHPQGCDHCGKTGYLGRSGIYEVIIIDQVLTDMIHDQASETELADAAQHRFPTMRQDGFARVLKGDTSLQEVLRVS